MTDEKRYTAVVKQGREHGVGRRYKAGAVVELSETELKAFGDKFEQVRPFDEKAPTAAPSAEPTIDLPDVQDGWQYTAVVKQGRTHGRNRQHNGGDTVTLDGAELKAFGDKFEQIRPADELITTLQGGYYTTTIPVILPTPPEKPESDKDMEPFIDGALDLSQASVGEILDAIDNGWVTAADAIAAEKQKPASRQRKSILNLPVATDEEE